MRADAAPDPELAPLPLRHPVVDTHCHLDVFDRGLHPGGRPEPDAMLAAAAAVGVTRIVQIGCDVEAAEWSVEMSRSRPEIAVGVALHPNDAARIEAKHGAAALDAALDRIGELAEDPQVRAVGETGLDYFRTGSEGHAVQQRAFRRHIALAKALGKPLVIHDRDAHDDVVRVLLEDGPPQTVVFHCFSGDAALAELCAEHGWYCSFAGVVTYKPNDALRDALAVVPDHLVLVETDAPYLTPVPHRGKPNGSYLMPFTVRAMAEVRRTDEESLGRHLWDNAQRVFGPW